MINRLIKRVEYVLNNSSLLLDKNGNKIIQEIKEVDDLEEFEDFITAYPSIGISRSGGEHIDFLPDNRGLRGVFCILAIRVYTKSESSPQAARSVLDITTWKVANALLKNPTLYIPAIDTDSNFLQDSNVTRILYGGRKKDQVYYEYATILFETSRTVFDPEPDSTYYDVLQTMINTSITGGNQNVSETT